jgi:hypothetical protein
MSSQGSTQYEDTTQQRHFGGDGGSGGGWGMPAHQRHSREKPFFLTSEFITAITALVALFIAAAVANDFGAERVWTLATVVLAAYIISRGLSKAGRGDGSVGR